MPRRPRHPAVAAARCCAVALALAGYLAAAIGFPVVARPGAAASPCGPSSCGCPAEARAHHSCCCARHGAATCCQPPAPEPREAEAHGCCSIPDDASLPCCAAKATPAPVHIQFVLGEQHQKCRGLNTLWVQTGAVAPPPSPISVSGDNAPTDFVAFDRFTFIGEPTAPTSPPPRVAG